MPGGVPSIDELRDRAAREGIAPSDVDLERVHTFLVTLLPSLAALETEVPSETVPAALFRPECER